MLLPYFVDDYFFTDECARVQVRLSEPKLALLDLPAIWAQLAAAVTACSTLTDLDISCMLLDCIAQALQS